MKGSKKVFMTLASIVGVFISITILLILIRIVLHDKADVEFNVLFMFLPLSLLIFIVFISLLIGRFVYYDALKRGMDPWVWTAITVFIPNLIGLIIYLVVRNQYTYQTIACTTCNHRIEQSFNLCPYCGTSAKPKCSECGLTVEEDWKLCPKCGKHL